MIAAATHIGDELAPMDHSVLETLCVRSLLR